ncbi:class III lanthionine synthetase LanKC [Streptomyces noursei]|uniref:class III lanthionine synthetase LanKC n=1 Tax=Streptomyces noursei TaxID=1971 RepID=UPI0030F228CC
MNSRPPAEAYCLADAVFYDTGNGAATQDDTVFPQAHAPAPQGWERHDRDVWTVYTPQGHVMPQQGWKIHISGLPDNAGRLVDVAFAYCLGKGIPFKFLRSRNVVTTHSLKYAPRSASGKIVTIYPSNENELHDTLTELAPALEGEPGPYILTDLRWGNGPLHVRYGGFVMRYCTDDDGATVPAIERPDGVLVPDRRRPVFELPDWVRLPDFLAPQLTARQSAGADADFPYRIEQALHFSNGGGVYTARHTDGRHVVLKEARPHAGLDGRGTDALARLERERRALQQLADIPGVPRLYGHHLVWEHHFLAVERMPGDTLQSWFARNYPLTRADATEEDLARYARRALALADRIERIVTAIHQRGMVFGDLHPGNVLVDDHDEVALVDFELAVPIEQAQRLGLGHPGFTGRGKTGLALDRHALAALRLWLLFPLTVLSELDPERVLGHIEVAERRFALPAGTLDALRCELQPAPEALTKVPDALRATGPALLDAQAPDWDKVRASMAQAIVLSATPERSDRLFPGDIRQFFLDGLNLAYGAAGVLWALHHTGAGRYVELEKWLVRAVERRSVHRPGFYDGLHGIAHVLEEFGYRDTATRLLADCRPGLSAVRDVSLFAGASGVGLNLLHFAARTNQGSYRDQALELAEGIAEAIRAGTAPGILRGTDRGARAGLLRGWSGPALFFLRLYQHTAERSHLDLALAALHRDLDLCRTGPDQTLQVDGGYRLLPYLEVGSAGIALVADEVLAHRNDDRLAHAMTALRRASVPEFVLEPNLFNGRAGLLATLTALDRHRPGKAPDAAVEGHLASLHWHAMSYRGHVAFPGEQLRRLSMDLATGNAGILLALAAALDGRRAFLPFLRP